MPPETDSIPRTTLIDLFTALRVVAKDSPTTLEVLRQHFCVDRKRRTVGDMLWSTAAYNAQELSRLGLVEISAIPKNKSSFERLKNRSLSITDAGSELIYQFKENRGEAYDRLFALMFAAHPYLRTFVNLLNNTPIFVPVVTSWKDHISPKYSSAIVLVEDVSRGKIDLDSFFHLLQARLKRELREHEQFEISEKMKAVLREVGPAATTEEPTEFAKKFLLKINDCVLPAIFKNEGLTFDYRTHRTLWSFGQEWKLWQSTSDHPEYSGRLVYKTATIAVSETGDKVESLSFDNGLGKTRENFLDKLYDAYLKVQQSTKDTYALAWQLRAVFCFTNRCQESVFDRLMEDYYTGSEQYDLTLEIQRHGQYERPLRVGKRNIGLVRVVKK
jgi:hypothetical protein